MGNMVYTSSGALGVTHPVLHLYHNRLPDWFAARSVEDAVEIAREYYRTEAGYDDEFVAEHQLLTLKQVSDDTVLGLVDEDDGDGNPVRKTALEWANLNGRGFWASSEY